MQEILKDGLLLMRYFILEPWLFMHRGYTKMALQTVTEKDKNVPLYEIVFLFISFCHSEKIYYLKMINYSDFCCASQWDPA